MTAPRLSVKASGHGGRGYALPAMAGEPFKLVTNTLGEKIRAKVDAEGKAILLPGITTLLKSVSKPAITQWAVDQTAAYAVANVDALLNRTQDQGWGYLRWYHTRTPDLTDPMRDYHVGVLNDAAELGTSIHEWMQADMGFGFYPEVNSFEMEQMIEAWEQFKFEHTIRNVRWAERTFWNSREGYAGTGDWWWDIDDTVDEFVDAKSSRSTWDDHMMQMAAMLNCDVQFEEITGPDWIEMPFIKPKSAAILHIRPDDLDSKGQPISRFCERKVIPMDDIPVYYKMFLGALDIAQGRYEMKQRDKARGWSLTK